MPTENEKRVFQAMTHLLCADRDTLTNYTHLARTTVHDALSRLEKEKAVVRFTQKNGHRGRPKTIFIVNPTYGQLIPEEWKRLQTSIVHVYQFFSDLHPDKLVFCSIQWGFVRYGKIKAFCQSQCGVRIGCMEANNSNQLKEE